jgi:hypothetical protein
MSQEIHDEVLSDPGNMKTMTSQKVRQYKGRFSPLKSKQVAEKEDPLVQVSFTSEIDIISIEDVIADIRLFVMKRNSELKSKVIGVDHGFPEFEEEQNNEVVRQEIPELPEENYEDCTVIKTDWSRQRVLWTTENEVENPSLLPHAIPFTPEKVLVQRPGTEEFEVHENLGVSNHGYILDDHDLMMNSLSKLVVMPGPNGQVKTFIAFKIPPFVARNGTGFLGTVRMQQKSLPRGCLFNLQVLYDKLIMDPPYISMVYKFFIPYKEFLIQERSHKVTCELRSLIMNLFEKGKSRVSWNYLRNKIFVTGEDLETSVRRPENEDLYPVIIPLLEKGILTAGMDYTLLLRKGPGWSTFCIGERETDSDVGD